MVYTVETPQTPVHVEPVVGRYRRPLLFYTLATGIPWGLWFTAGHLSQRPDATTATWVAVGVLGLGGLLAPLAVAWALVRPDPALRADVLRRLVNVRDVPAWAWAVAVFGLPLALLVATAISIPLGYPPDQFLLRGGVSFTAGLIPAWLTLMLAPVVEELAWHSYGTDALASRWSVLTSSLVFGLIWFFWHVPLGTIEGYYQNEVVETGLLASVNFGVSVFPFIVLMNWVYFRSGRNVPVTIVFHLAANIGNELFLTHPDTKVIQTAILLVACGLVVWHDRDLFLTRPTRVAA